MNLRSFVGIDPASGDFECALIQAGELQARHKTFSIRVTELDQMIEWIEKSRLTLLQSKVPVVIRGLLNAPFDPPTFLFTALIPTG
jgi:hypothetical protein